MKLVRLWITFAAVALGLLAPVGPSAARRQQQQPAPPRQDEAQADDRPVYIREVRVPVSVLDKKNAAVTGLRQSDFLVFEDKVPMQIVSFREAKETEKLAVYIGVLMDTSYSTAGKLKFEKEAAINFIDTVTRSRKDYAAFVTFDDDVNLRQDFTKNRDLLADSINAVKKPGNRTSLYDAVWQFCDEKMRSVGGGRRALVIITDGDDTYSRATLREAIEIAQQTDTVIFAISTKGGFVGSTVPGVEAGLVKDSEDKDLQKLAEETGGRAFFSGDMLALERSFKRIGEELRTQYLISYRPTNDKYDGSRRTIEVRLANKQDGWKVRAKRGYRATKDLVGQ